MTTLESTVASVDAPVALVDASVTPVGNEGGAVFSVRNSVQM
jgi:hypothetical protein